MMTKSSEYYTIQIVKCHDTCAVIVSWCLFTHSVDIETACEMCDDTMLEYSAINRIFLCSSQDSNLFSAIRL